MKAIRGLASRTGAVVYRPFSRAKESRFKKLFVAVALYLIIALGIIISVSMMEDVPIEDKTVTVAIEQAVQSPAELETVVETIDTINQDDRFIGPFDRTDTKPRIGIIVKGLGLYQGRTKKAILDLPPAVTLAFSPYVSDISLWVGESIKSRHEALIAIPMEPQDFPNIDPGMLALMRGIEPEENSARLDQISAMVTGNVGFMNSIGNAYLEEPENLRGIYAWVRGEGALFVEDMMGNFESSQRADFKGEQYIASDIQIDAIATPDSIVARLRKLERDAIENGYAIATASDLPVTLEVIDQWSKTLEERGVILATISAVVERRNERGI